MFKNMDNALRIFPYLILQVKHFLHQLILFTMCFNLIVINFYPTNLILNNVISLVAVQL